MKMMKNQPIHAILIAGIIAHLTCSIHSFILSFIQVFAVGLPNPYRLRAFVSARVPLNGTFSPYINMYNPFPDPIQITEMYSSGDDLHLDLLSNENEVISIFMIYMLWVGLMHARDAD